MADISKRAQRDAYWAEHAGMSIAIRVGIIAVVAVGTIALIVIAFVSHPSP